MSTFREMQKRHQKEFDILPIKYAFDKGQFEKIMKEWGLRPEDTDKIIRVVDGGYMQVKDKHLFTATCQRHDSERKKAIAQDATGEGFIYQMFYCTFYDYEADPEEVLEVLGYTWEQIQADKRLKHGWKGAVRRFRDV